MTVNAQDLVAADTGLRRAGGDELAIIVDDDARKAGETQTVEVRRHVDALPIPAARRGRIIPDPRLVAIVDRVTFNAHIIEPGTDSSRLRHTIKTRARRSRG